MPFSGNGAVMLKNYIWYEKYRPKGIEQLVLSSKIKKQLEQYIASKEIPHLLLHGPFGSGKTTVSQILIRACASSSLVLNASSSDRGIGVIKERVKNFAATVSINPKKCNIVLFDEADGLTTDAMEALKNTIETYQKHCRFIFTANNIHKIDGAIISRCSVISFDALPKEKIFEQVEAILKAEKIKFQKDDITSLIDRFAPDIRAILNNLQIGSTSGVFKLKEIFDDYNFLSIMTFIKTGKIGELRKTWQGVVDFGWLYRLLFNKFLLTAPKGKQGEIAIVIADYLYKDRIVADKEINASVCCTEIALLLSDKIQIVF